MSAGTCRNLVIYVGQGDGPPETFNKLGAFRTNGMTINGELVDITDKDSLGFREGLDGGGIRNLSFTGAGAFKDGAEEENLRLAALNQTKNNYQMRTTGGHIFEGPFQVTSYERSGEVNGAEEFSVTMESVGTVTYQA